MIASRGSMGWVRVHPVVPDCLLTLLVTALALTSLFSRVAQVLVTEEGTIHFEEADALGVGLVLAGTAPLMWRRRAPIVVVALTAAALLAYEGLGYAPPAAPFALLVALYTAAVLRPPKISGGVTVAVVLGAAVAPFRNRGPVTDDETLAVLFALVGAWMLGYAVRLTRTRTALLEDVAATVMREQAARTELAVQQEHARIAREMHDIVAHNVSIMVAQARGGRSVFDRQPEQARQMLDSIESTGREALIEMRRLVGVLGEGTGDGERAPQPGLAQLPGLIAQVRRAGLAVELVVRGTPRPLSAGVELNAYRIAQEALTNALKHADATRVTVTLGYSSKHLELKIRDNGRGGSAVSTLGHGLIGMRQRVALLRGEIQMGRAVGAGFQVTAALPLESGPR